MVVFTCNTCSTVLKRNKVESHCFQCRGCESLSCVDCGKDFWGDDYQTHTKCISEVEKYGRKDAVVKVNKGEAKQDQWIEQVQNAIDQASSKPSLKRLLERIKQNDNIPRKKAKFENFVKNSLKCYDTSLIAASWDVLMTSKRQTQDENKKEAEQDNLAGSSSPTNGHKKGEASEDADQAVDESTQPTVLKNKKERKEERRKKSQKKEKKHKTVEVSTENATSDAPKKSKKRKRNESESIEEEKESHADKENNKKKNKKKRKADECVTDDAEGEHNGNDALQEDVEVEEEAEPPKKRKKTKFNWEEVITEVLKKKGELTLKRLKKKVLCEFAAQDATSYSDENLSAKFDKKVKKIAGVKVFKDRAILKSAK